MRSQDEQLVRQFLAGDRDAFTRLMERYRNAVCAIAYSFLGNVEDVQDAVQETFVLAYTRLRRLREPEKFGPWLRRIAANICVDMLRRSRQHTTLLDRLYGHAPQAPGAQAL